MSTINAKRRQKSRTKIFPVAKYPRLDRFILCRWNLIYGCIVEDSGNSLEELLSAIPGHLDEANDEVLCVSEVISWRGDPNMNELEVHETETLYQIYHYADPSEEEDEDERKTNDHASHPA